MPRLPALLLALLILPLLLFAVFGFLASFEPLPNPLPWRIGYAVAALLLSFMEIRLLIRLVKGPTGAG
ncbi:MAG: hypothetical protein ACO3QA_05855 [Phycisphaerales bacterium]